MLSYVIPTESLQIKVERDFFTKNPNLGEIIHWAPVMGDILLSANDFPPKIRKFIVQSRIWDFIDNMTSRVD